MVISQIILILSVVFHKALYLDLFFFSYTSMTFLMLVSSYHFIFLLMIPIFILKLLTLLSLRNIMNREMKYVKNWLDANKLALNIEKTNFVYYFTLQ